MDNILVPKRKNAEIIYLFDPRRAKNIGETTEENSWKRTIEENISAAYMSGSDGAAASAVAGWWHKAQTRRF